MIYYTGDIHGSTYELTRFCYKMSLSEEDIIVILGDVGANYYGGKRDREFKEAVSLLKSTIFCVHGNHEKRPATIPSYKLKAWNGGMVWYEENYPIIFTLTCKPVETITGNNAFWLVRKIRTHKPPERFQRQASLLQVAHTPGYPD